MSELIKSLQAIGELTMTHKITLAMHSNVLITFIFYPQETKNELTHTGCLTDGAVINEPN